MTFIAWKLALIDRMSTDSRLTATDFRVAYRILYYADKATGDCYPRQETIAADLDLTDRGVRLAISNLRLNGYLKFEQRAVPGQRGKRNFYDFGYQKGRSTTGTVVPLNAPTTGTTTGTEEPDFRKSGSGPSIREPFELKNPDNPVGESRAKRARSNGIRIPDDFKPDLSFALTLGMRPDQVEREAAKFLDYWKAQPGARARKLDWPATWRYWCRKAVEYAPRREKSNSEQTEELLQKLRAEEEAAHGKTTH